MRYRGQSYELEIPLGPQFVHDFHELHRRTFGHATPDAVVEAVNLRLRSHVPAAAIAPARLKRQAQRPIPIARTRVIVGAGWRTVPVYDREVIGAAARLH